MFCKFCNQEKGDRFYKYKSSGKLIPRKKCKDCWSRHYKHNQREISDEIQKYKLSKKCEICSFDDGRALQFHHKDKNDKMMEVSNMVNRGFNITNIKKEINKCQCICANCHQILHHEERLLNREAV
tara:strand:+ start:66 stop:443 length:378 start_codon:yes stop_codon:yes gene_type:complete